jgi:ribosomal protein S6--L-glutamate ligase
MKIAILSRNPKLYSTARLVQAAKDRGHEPRVIDHIRCFMDMGTDNPSVHYKDEEFVAGDFDAVIPRIGASVSFYGTAVVRQFEMMGTYCVNESVAISPVTAFANSPDDVGGLIREVGGAPLVIKLLEGTQGIGVVLAETKKAAESVIQAFMGVNSNILIQEFIKEAGGSDIRCLVVNGKVIAAMQRTAQEGEFRSNIHRGGSAQLVKLTPKERATAVKAANVMGLNVCGVDLLRSDRGPLVMEVNSSPGLRGIEEATKKDVAGMIIESIEANAKPNKTKTRGKG